MIVPVRGVARSSLTDTFTQARAAGARAHDAIDIVAPAGTPVIAAASGIVEKLFLSRDGGNTVYVRTGDRRWSHYYAHLAAYAPGLREGQHVARGTLLGAVGSTGNADPAGPHLHFAIHAMAPGDQWYQGRAINPYPLLMRR
jgi:murein DD-endopeptidase MepM/ murein hydrolase activator NlpD